MELGWLLMNRPAVIVLLLVGGAMLLLAGQREGGPIDGDGNPLNNWNLDALTDNAMTLFNRAQDAVASATDTTPPDQVAINRAAWVTMIGQAEGADYSTCFGYRFTISDFTDHPAVMGTWTGEKLSDDMCANAGFGPGCVSTAAGKGQIKKATWLRVKGKLGLVDFSPASQDAAILQLTADRGALAAVDAGDLTTAVSRCRNEWASLPGNYAKQGQRSLDQLLTWFNQAGGQAVTA